MSKKILIKSLLHVSNIAINTNVMEHNKCKLLRY